MKVELGALEAKKDNEQSTPPKSPNLQSLPLNCSTKSSLVSAPYVPKLGESESTHPPESLLVALYNRRKTLKLDTKFLPHN